MLKKQPNKKPPQPINQTKKPELSRLHSTYEPMYEILHPNKPIENLHRIDFGHNFSPKYC